MDIAVCPLMVNILKTARLLVFKSSDVQFGDYFGDLSSQPLGTILLNCSTSQVSTQTQPEGGWRLGKNIRGTELGLQTSVELMDSQ